MSASVSFSQLVRERVQELGTSPYALATQAGLPEDAIRSVVSSGGLKHVPSLNRAAEICNLLGITFVLGAPPAQSDARADEYEFLPRIDLAAGAGGGQDNADPVSVDHLAFRRDWLRRTGVKPGNAVLFTVRGDSMAPGLNDRDLVLVDMGRADPATRKIFAFTDTDGSARIKRLEPSPGALALRSDNPDYPIEYRSGEDANRMRIIGEIVWSARSWR
jgi:phage repressor protein C with HTH and peptisase S24 domain